MPACPARRRHCNRPARFSIYPPILSWRPAQPVIVGHHPGTYVRVQHRHIIYIQGYDPRGLAQYYRMFRTELRKFGRLYQLQATISRPKVAPDDEIASWTIDTKAEDWQTRTAYDFLRFEDFIQQDIPIRPTDSTAVEVIDH